MEVKKKPAKTSGSVKILPEVLEEARAICKDKGLILSVYIKTAVWRENARQRRMK